VVLVVLAVAVLVQYRVFLLAQELQTQAVVVVVEPEHQVVILLFLALVVQV
jgi:hypothetical protein